MTPPFRKMFEYYFRIRKLSGHGNTTLVVVTKDRNKKRRTLSLYDLPLPHPFYGKELNLILGPIFRKGDL